MEAKLLLSRRNLSFKFIIFKKKKKNQLSKKNYRKSSMFAISISLHFFAKIKIGKIQFRRQ